MKFKVTKIIWDDAVIFEGSAEVTVPLAATEMKTLKDLASAMGLHTRTVKRWWKALDVPPDVQGHASHRWSDESFALLLKRWGGYWRARGKDASITGQKFSGSLTDANQLPLNLHVENKKIPQKISPKVQTQTRSGPGSGKTGR